MTLIMKQIGRLWTINKAVKMWSDSQNHTKSPAYLVFYVLRIVKIKKVFLKMITPGI